MRNRIQWRDLLVAILFGWSVSLLAGCPVVDGPPPITINDTTPSAEMQSIVSAVAEYRNEKLAIFYAEFADLIERDDEIIRSTGDIREAHIRAGRLAYQRTGMQSETPGLGAKVDAAIAEAIGIQNRPLTPEIRSQAVEVFRALSWALRT
jgi:hypothetical protein